MSSSPSINQDTKPKSQPHPISENLFALFAAAAMFSLGIFLLQSAGLLTGGTAGLTLLLSKLTPLSFGQWFFLLNLPFYFLAWRQMGLAFTRNTIITVLTVSIGVDALQHLLQLTNVHPLYAALAGGVLMGNAMLVLFRHQASLGGFNILALFMQQRYGWRAGKVQLGLDACILLASFFIVPWWLLLLSILGAVVCNLALTFNHKPGRYQP